MVLSTLFGHGNANGGALGLRHRLRETNRLRLQGRLVVKLDVAIQWITHDLVFSEEYANHRPEIMRTMSTKFAGSPARRFLIREKLRSRVT